MRLRVFGTRNILSKHNLIKWVPGVRLGGGTHLVYGTRLSPVKGATLHFKYFHDFGEKVNAEVRRGEHWMDATQYQAYAKGMSDQPGVSLYYFGSVRLRHSRQLVELGLMNSNERFEEFAAGRATQKCVS